MWDFKGLVKVYLGRCGWLCVDGGLEVAVVLLSEVECGALCGLMWLFVFMLRGGLNVLLC